MTFELSPSLVNGAAGEQQADAYELKFLLPADEAARAEAWARQRLTPDVHGDEGRYLTTSLYCDTPAFDVYHRSAGFKRAKYRVRRYGDSDTIFLERKRRKGDVVAKRRDAIAPPELALLDTSDVSLEWPGCWFYRQVQFRGLRPACRIAYNRTAFMGTSATGAVRLTLDRDVTGVPADGWHVAPVEGGKVLVSDSVILELKFRATLPPLFLELLSELPAGGQGVSKYRLCIDAWGLSGERGGCQRG
jgi:hypothetical protein